MTKTDDHSPNLYGTEYPNHINYYYVTDVNGEVYGADKLKNALKEVPDGVKIVKVENTNHPYDSEKDEIDWQTEDGTIDITHTEHIMVDFSDMLHIGKKKNFIMCYCCKAKIILGETYYVLEAGFGEAHINCPECVSHSVLAEWDVENFWKHHSEDEFDLDDYDDE